MKKLAMLLTAGLIACSCIAAQAEEPARRSLTVSGLGSVTAQNDMATVNLTVQTSSRDAKEAARENANIMTAVRQAVIDAGADAGKIETLGYNLYPVNQYDDKGRVKSKMYEADNRMKVVVGDLDNAGKVMDAAINAGANRVDSVNFSVRNGEQYKDAALRAAAQDARRKADILAASLGRTVVNVISVNEDTANVTPIMYRAMKVEAGGVGADAATPLEAGEAKFESHVTVVFEIG